MTFAKNSSTSRELFELRRAYPYPTTENVELPVNFWYSDKNLTKFGTSGYPIIIQKKLLRKIDSALVLPEVAVAAKTLQDNMKLLAKVGKTCVSTILTDFRFKKGFVDIDREFALSFRVLKNSFFNYLDNFQISNFKEYIQKLHLFCITYSKTLPVTPMTVFLNKCTAYSSGLSLDFETLPHDDDNVKVAKFISSPAFADYTRLCGEHGFYVNMNAPWNIVANLNSEQFNKIKELTYEQYFEKYKLMDDQTVLLYFFNLFMTFVYESYEDYNRLKPFFEKETKCLDKLLFARDMDTKIVSTFELCIVYTKILLNEHGKPDTVTYRAKNINEMLRNSYNLLGVK